MELGTIARLWRYPVKSLRAEPLERAAVDPDGLRGDRTAALIVETPTHARAGKPYRGKESRYLHLTPDPETAASYAADANVLVTLGREQPRYFDARPVSVLFDLWVRDVEALVGEELDPQRWRPNLYVTAAPGFAKREPDLLGATLRAGDVELRVVDTIKRCVTTTYDVATGEPLPLVLEAVATERANVVGVYCEVVTPGELAVGDALISIM
ncbi:MAG TPA: MOSC N-terminal beta barrel domain-containing protein [Candidatus Elarobacter sp.]|nr:MOSC N-terminal beta barrel domain-containing protein [Candidatus Elarobacter sp.]